MFPHKLVDITIQPADATDYILGNPAFTVELEERINQYRSKQEKFSIKAGELL